MTNNRIILALVAASALLLGACNADIDISFDHNRIDGSGVLTTNSYAVSDFDKIEVCCLVDVELEVSGGTTKSVTVSTDDNLHALLDVAVKNGDTLSIKPKSNNDHLASTGPMVVRITGFTIRGLDVSSATSVSGSIDDSLEVEIRGDAAASIDLRVDSDHATIKAGSASDVTLTGRVDFVDVVADSAASVNLEAINIKVATIDAGSGASIDIAVTESIAGKADSGARIRVSGDPERARFRTDSGASVEYIDN